jgi:hypothetical protein
MHLDKRTWSFFYCSNRKKKYPVQNKKMYIRIGMVLGSVVLLSLLSKWTQGSNKTPTSSISHVRQLVRESATYAMKSKQDTNPLIALQHAIYAMAYMEAARKFATDDQISYLAGSKASDLIHSVKKREQKALKHVVTTCPAVAPQAVAATGWM